LKREGDWRMDLMEKMNVKIRGVFSGGFCISGVLSSGYNVIELIYKLLLYEI
jgi:hypothetical protein